MLVYLHVLAPRRSTSSMEFPMMLVMELLMLLVMELLMLCISLAVGLYLTSCWSRATRLLLLRSYVLCSYLTTGRIDAVVHLLSYVWCYVM